ncbi:MAG: hydroxyphenylacetyl-CoA thioesterase PaaI [Paracoccaceae bacterium]|uniref:hydroxyphenylacetyl-CoA thioesterase PaaI n=1 Tax=Seohaeicola saemankumensis TaxID=481181 RepID=UPI001E65A52F|nr:hydroxyphenylacetyl-CoA thioesterase PaaI [Seohaeicola saemankumensis]MCD1625197.1 hydroxyphenylacetyl-CoA thioesterase PaaI [Seohaeicola saemankumensis]
MTLQERAERSAAAMWSTDVTSQSLELVLVSIAPGQARMTMTVRPDHLNGHGICHGGYIFTLADTAFAYACNSHNKLVVAQENTITYLSPGKKGEVLTALAQEVHLAGRSGVYDVTVTGEDGRKVALFRGLSRQISGEHFKEDNT